MSPNKKIDNFISVERKTPNIHDMYDSIRNSQKNSLIPFKLIKDYPYKYQSYLGRIYGYLLNQIIWWKETHHSIMFHDIENIPKIEAFNNFKSLSGE